MSKSYGKLITGSTSTYPFLSITTASGFWSVKDEFQARGTDSWPTRTIPIVYYLVVGGGGGGGGSTSGAGTGQGGGGGAGGLITGSFAPAYKQPLTSYGYTLTISIGAGGVGRIAGQLAANGGNSSVTGQYLNLIGYGGGGGGGNSVQGAAGASGGGGGGGYPGFSSAAGGGAATQPTSIYGGLGNPGAAGDYAGGGGGGSGGLGSHGATAGTTYGGAGTYISVASGSSYSDTFAKGGGILDYTGYGTGGYPGQPSGVNGKDGVVILWYPYEYSHLPFNITGAYTTIVQNGYRIYRFTGSSSITLS